MTSEDVDPVPPDECSGQDRVLMGGLGVLRASSSIQREQQDGKCVLWKHREQAVPVLEDTRTVFRGENQK